MEIISLFLVIGGTILGIGIVVSMYEWMECDVLGIFE